jgi:dihydrofolate reductase
MGNVDQKKTLSIIVALADNYAIGKNNELLCEVPGDLKRFKEITSGQVVVMGERTYDSLPKKPLPNRHNIVLTDDEERIFPDCTVVHSINEAIEQMSGEKENFVIGGGSVYRQFLPVADQLYLTWIHDRFEDADTFFPDIDFSKWEETYRENYAPPSTQIPHSFVIYRRLKR